MYELPESVLPFAGRITDVDSHEMVPAQLWVEEFGETVRPWAEITMAAPIRPNGNNMNIPGYPGDVGEIDPETAWTTKGSAAPAATDMNRRNDLMDTMAISRQLMFPSGVGLGGSILYGSAEGTARYKTFGEKTYSVALDLIKANNDWAVRVAKISDRFRPVTPIFGDTPEELMDMTKSLIDRGIRAVQIQAPRLPGGVSPASKKLDPFYAMLAEAKVPLTLHTTGLESLLFRTNDWGDAEEFQGYKMTEEGSLDPWTLSIFHLAPQNFIATLVTGGVFDRHPTLRVGVMEYTAHWIGPLARMLDLWRDNNQAILPKTFADGSEGRRLPMRPSEYISRNVRVSPFDFEPVGEYIEKFGLEDVYCFASDYPHVEGGKKPIDKFAASLEPLGHRVMEKFFVTNGELMLPD
ncbi:amidohydrolase family protein [Sphingobium sp. Sx8-8]|uniref:amidohydrolase family protein n=1 Tax=Sphingobium sp. Sx8-8 TaxID=2933617 RepID=UPI001F5A5C80|nr:amidohydrolase family protein [Sphingobium sp. Sx8-8]